MYRASFWGEHYAAGFEFGKAMREKGFFFEERHLLSDNEQRIAFAKECEKLIIPIFPQIIEELHGISDGQGIEYEKISAFILGMYCFKPEWFCSCIATNAGGKVVFGRNSDFLIALKNSYGSFFYQPKGGNSFIGNSTAFSQMEDGINCHGLAVGITSVIPKRVQPGFNTGLLARYILERCENVEQAIEAVQTLPIATAQTLTLADKSGRIAVIECCCDAIEVIYPNEGENFVYAVNDFRGEKTTPNSIYFGEEQSLFAKKRSEVIEFALKKANGSQNAEYIKEILSGEHGFTCQYDSRSGFDTVWSSLYEISGEKVFICEGNPAKCEFEERKELKFPPT